MYSFMKRIVLLTGGIASGKTFVSDYLSKLNAHVIDTDVIARNLLLSDASIYSNSALKSVKDCFGNEIFVNDQLDRKKLRNIIFNDSDAKKSLEEIMHPLIYRSVIEQLDNDTGSYHLIVIPLLNSQSPYLKLAHDILVIEVDPITQRERVMMRDGIDEVLADRIISSQASNQERRNLASTIIVNTNESYTRNILKQLDKQYSLAPL